jgi:hypothetical protein
MGFTSGSFGKGAAALGGTAARRASATDSDVTSVRVEAIVTFHLLVVRAGR